MRTLKIIPFAVAALWFLNAGGSPAPAQAQAAAERVSSVDPRPRRFVIAPAADAELQRLWTSSSSVKQERVACLGGDRDDSLTQITRVLVLEPGAADSLGISAERSIETCGPPRWFGTVHTHIALRDGEHPYSRFSGADRGVMRLWWRRWQADGTFCLLYTATAAHCEIDGITVRLIGGPESEIHY